PVAGVPRGVRMTVRAKTRTPSENHLPSVPSPCCFDNDAADLARINALVRDRRLARVHLRERKSFGGAVRAGKHPRIGLARVSERLALAEIDVEQPFLGSRFSKADGATLAIVKYVGSLVDDEV